jgi:hypothetical protein
MAAFLGWSIGTDRSSSPPNLAQSCSLTYRGSTRIIAVVMSQ